MDVLLSAGADPLITDSVRPSFSSLYHSQRVVILALFSLGTAARFGSRASHWKESFCCAELRPTSTCRLLLSVLKPAFSVRRPRSAAGGSDCLPQSLRLLRLPLLPPRPAPLRAAPRLIRGHAAVRRHRAHPASPSGRANLDQRPRPSVDAPGDASGQRGGRGGRPNGEPRAPPGNDAVRVPGGAHPPTTHLHPRVPMYPPATHLPNHSLAGPVLPRSECVPCEGMIKNEVALTSAMFLTSLLRRFFP